MLLGERLRSQQERMVVQRALEETCGLPGGSSGIKLDIDNFYTDSRALTDETVIGRVDTADLGTIEQLKQAQLRLKANAETSATSPNANAAAGLGNIATTSSLKRLFRLVGRSIQHKEPVLLVGETGCGKTTVCQLFAVLLRQHLHVVNCHQHTEAGDLLGSLRPVRGKDKVQTQLRVCLMQYGQLVRSALPSLPLPSNTLDALHELCKGIDASLPLPKLMSAVVQLQDSVEK